MQPPTDMVLCRTSVQSPVHTDSFEDSLGRPGELPSLGRHLAHARLRLPASISDLQEFLIDYRDNLLLPRELPAICRAYHHAHAYEVRELMAFDRSLARLTLPPSFSFASQAIGQRYLRRLRPLRDVRLVRRYLRAIHHHRAHGWHTLVYGCVISIYSVPLRQGLLGYASQTLAGFLDASTSHLRLPPAARHQLIDRTWDRVPSAVNQLLPGIGSS